MNISAGTLARTIALALALVNQVFAILGMPILNIDDATIYEIISLAATVGTSIWAWWKNTPITTAAIKSNEVLEGIKNGEITEDEVDEFLL